jgi:hypothetical protein
MNRTVHFIWLVVVLIASSAAYFIGENASNSHVPSKEPSTNQPASPKSIFKSDGVVWDTDVVLKFRIRGDDEIGPREIEAFDELYKEHDAGKLLGRPASELTAYLRCATSIVILKNSVIIEIVRKDKSDGKQCSLKIRLPDGIITEVGFENLPF